MHKTWVIIFASLDLDENCLTFDWQKLSRYWPGQFSSKLTEFKLSGQMFMGGKCFLSGNYVVAVFSETVLFNRNLLSHLKTTAVRLTIWWRLAMLMLFNAWTVS